MPHDGRVPLAQYLMALRDAPERSGNFFVRDEDRRVGVATVTHFGAGMTGFFIRTLHGQAPQVQTQEVRVEFERQNEAWTAVLVAFGQATGRDPSLLGHEG